LVIAFSILMWHEKSVIYGVYAFASGAIAIAASYLALVGVTRLIRRLPY
jgi:hypothetical protein